MNLVLAIVAGIQALALGAVALRLAWPEGRAETVLESVEGAGIQQDPDDFCDGARERVGFRQTPGV